MLKQCLNCKKEFGGGNTRKFCSHLCANLFKKVESKRRIESGTQQDYRLVKQYLLEKYGNACASCHLTEWLNRPIALVLDHVDGNHTNNTLENCRLLCNNCDALTSTYKNRNKGNGRYVRKLRYEQGKSY